MEKRGVFRPSISVLDRVDSGGYLFDKGTPMTSQRPVEGMTTDELLVELLSSDDKCVVKQQKTGPNFFADLSTFNMHGYIVVYQYATSSDTPHAALSALLEKVRKGGG